MELKISESTAKRLYSESLSWFREVLEETFGKQKIAGRKFDEIRTFEDACEEIGINPLSIFSDIDTCDEIAYKKLKVIAKAINQGWTPDWTNTNQKKWSPWFDLSSGFGFSVSVCYCARTRMRLSAPAFALRLRPNQTTPQNSLFIYTKSY